jgi:hypothetical protein
MKCEVSFKFQRIRIKVPVFVFARIFSSLARILGSGPRSKVGHREI